MEVGGGGWGLAGGRARFEVEADSERGSALVWSCGRAASRRWMGALLQVCEVRVEAARVWFLS